MPGRWDVRVHKVLQRFNQAFANTMAAARECSQSISIMATNLSTITAGPITQPGLMQGLTKLKRGKPLGASAVSSDFLLSLCQQTHGSLGQTSCYKCSTQCFVMAPSLKPFTLAQRACYQNVFTPNNLHIFDPSCSKRSLTKFFAGVFMWRLQPHFSPLAVQTEAVRGGRLKLYLPRGAWPP